MDGDLSEPQHAVAGNSAISTADDSPRPSGPTLIEPLVNDLVVSLGSDSLGRKVYKRGRDFVIEVSKVDFTKSEANARKDPVVHGHQWAGTDELSDDTDAPVW